MAVESLGRTATGAAGACDDEAEREGESVWPHEPATLDRR